MSVETASSIQKVDSDDSIVACQQDAADFFDSIDPELPSTARNKAHVHGQAKHSLAKVSGAAASGLSLLGAML